MSLQEEHQEETQETKGEAKGAETRARGMGWVPEEEFRGPKEKWVDAETFLDETIPVLRKRNRDLDSKLTTVTAKMTEVESTLKEFSQYHSKVAEREYKRAVRDLKAKQKKAAEEGDAEAVGQIGDEIDALKEDATPKKEEGKPDHPDFAAWRAENDWYDTDVEMTAYAEQIGPIVGRSVKVGGRPFFDAIRKEVEKKFPERFGNQSRKKAPAVEGAGGAKGKPTGRSFNDLPPEARKACDSFVKSIPGFTREQYIKDYEWE